MIVLNILKYLQLRFTHLHSILTYYRYHTPTYLVHYNSAQLQLTESMSVVTLYTKRALYVKDAFLRHDSGEILYFAILLIHSDMRSKVIFVLMNQQIYITLAIISFSAFLTYFP